MRSIRNVLSHLSGPLATFSTQETPSDAAVAIVPLSRVATLAIRAHGMDQLIKSRLRPLALPALRLLLGLVFIWFGGLKVAGVSPVEALVTGTIPWGNPDVVVPVLGGVEVILGLGLVTGVALRLVLPVLAAHLTGTFLTFVMLPGEMFRLSDPLLLTQSGEFVTKNLILISAIIVLMVHNSPKEEPPSGPRLPG